MCKIILFPRETFTLNFGQISSYFTLLEALVKLKILFSITVYSKENFLGRFSDAAEVVVSSFSSPGEELSDLTTTLLVDGLGVVCGVVS